MTNKINDDYDIISMSDRDIYSNSSRDISSHSHYEDISSSKKPSGSKSPRGKKKKQKPKWVKVTAVCLCIVLVLFSAFYIYAYSLISKIERVPLDQEDLGISTDVYGGVRNIALLGLDTREDNATGRADANVILTIDKKHNKIKLTSIARDTYVSIDGHKKDKLTHAYAYGKSQLSVKTLNQNFGLEITDYVTMNFFELARIIDQMGGVEIDVSDAEFKELNGYVIPTTDFGDIPCEKLKSAGVQTLSGAQAVCYARIRHTDSDIERGNRQKEVLMAMLKKAKSMNPLELPSLASLIVSECATSLSTSDIISLGAWVVLAGPEFEQLSIPNDNIKASGKTINGAWCYVYDLNKAKTEIKDFIFEENYYDPKTVAEREAENNK